MSSTFDTIIVGAGPAGLSAALLLGRCQRPVLLCDHGRPRNWASPALNAFLTRDGIDPADFRRIGRNELRKYPSVSVREHEVVEAERREDEFHVVFDDGERAQSRTLLLATGLVDVLPGVQGMRQFYGKGVFHCPFCDGWEHRNLPWAVLGGTVGDAEYALDMLTWTNDVILCTNGRAELDAPARERLTRGGILIIDDPVERLEGNDRLERIVFASGRAVTRSALFFRSDQVQRSQLPARLGCDFDGEGIVRCDGHAATGVPGLYVAGNVRCGLQLSIFAAAEGAEAAYRINEFLHQRELAPVESPETAEAHSQLEQL